MDADPVIETLRRVARAAADAAGPEALCDELAAAFRLAPGAGDVRLLEAAPDGAPRLANEIARVVATCTSLQVPGTDPGADLLVPVGHPGNVFRVAILTASRTFTPAEISHAETLADLAAAGLARLDGDRRHAAAADGDRALMRAAQALNASLELEDVLCALAREAALAVGADLAGVYLGNGVDGGVATAGHGVPDGWHGRTVAPGEGAVGTVLMTGEALVTGDDRCDETPRRQDRVRTSIAMPMAWNDELKGALSVGWTTDRRVEDEDRRKLEAIADLATVACHNAEAYHQIREAASTDALTGLLNHGAMKLRVQEEIARARRDGTPLSCVIIDLDDFKRVNDSGGHQAGDDLLRRVAALLRTALRPYDRAARYGGDEFVLLLPGSDEDTALAAAERVRDAIAGDHAGACSLGVARWHEPLDADGLLERADRALLLAKRTGKGRVAVANADVERELALLRSRRGSPEALQALAAAIEQRDGYAREHSEHVVRLARGVAMILGLHSEQVERIARAALLHDVGKLEVPDEILRKPGPLSPAEWELMAVHPVAGERIVLRIPDLAVIAPIVRHEHEHWDGSGYPDGLHGARIPVGSRIVLACDAYQAMISDRPYRPAMPVERAIAELSAGARFDPDVVEALIDLLSEQPPGAPDRASVLRMPAAPTPGAASWAAARAGADARARGSGGGW